MKEIINLPVNVLVKNNLVKKQFEEVGLMARNQAVASKQKPNQVRKINFFTDFKPSLPCMNTLIKKKNLSVLRSDDNLKTIISCGNILLYL